MRTSQNRLRSIPNELLIEIFRCYVDLQDSPWRLTLVCKVWRRMVLTTSSLWTHIVITNNAYLPKCTKWNILGSAKYSIGQACVCISPNELRAAQHLSGSQPLCVEVFREPNGSAVDSPFSSSVKEIFSPELSRRMTQLDINMYDTSANIIFRFADYPTVPLFGPFPILEVLRIVHIPDGWIKTLVKSVSTSSFKSLRHLELPRTMVWDLHIDTLVRELPKLERLSGGSMGWPDESTAPISMPCMRELELDSRYHYLNKIQLPRLQSLDLRERSHRAPSHRQDSETIDLPELTSLTALTSSTRWLTRVVAPRLRVLSIAGVFPPCDTNDQVHLLSPDLFPTVVRFGFQISDSRRFKNADAEDTVLISALQAVPGATSVRIGAKPLRDGTSVLRPELLNRLGAMSEDMILCPRLRNLKIVSLGRVASGLSHEDTELLRRIVEVRKQTGRPLRELVVEWSDSSRQVVHQRFV